MNQNSVRLIKRYGVLFVCLGNICRSPLAEWVFKDLVAKRGLDKQIYAASCGTGAWHVGEPAHHGSRAVGRKYGVSLDTHRARQLCANDFSEFDLILAMDQSNYSDLKAAAPKRTLATIRCFRDFDEHAESLDVPDPYYGGPETFEEVYRIAERSSKKLLDYIVGRMEGSK